MKKLFLIVMAVCILALPLWLVQGKSQQTGISNHKFHKAQKAIPNSYIVVLKDEIQLSEISEIAHQLAVNHEGNLSYIFQNSIKGFSIQISEIGALALSQDPRVEFVEEDREVIVETDQYTSPVNTQVGDTQASGFLKTRSFVPQATQTNAPAGLDRIDQRGLTPPNGIDGLYTYTYTGAGVDVYVVDSGISRTHQDFGGRVSQTDYFDFDPKGDGSDHYYHGTSVASVIGGNTYGVAKGVALYSVRVLDSAGGSTTERVIGGVEWLTSHHKKSGRPAVANMSLGFEATSNGVSALETAIRNSIGSGITYVAATSDGSTDVSNISPARMSEVLAVAASYFDTSSDFWSAGFGSGIDIYAPGVAIPTADWLNDRGITIANGTSFAAPHVAGVAAMYLQAHPRALPSEVIGAITSNGTPNLIRNIPVTTPPTPNLLLYSGFLNSPICTYSITPASASFPSVGGTGSITLTTQSTCSWTAISSASWLIVTSVSSGTGNGTVTYQVATNTNSTSRSATLTVGGQVHLVTQAGYVGPCTLSLTPSSRTFTSSGGSGSVSVSSTCNWGATSNVSWLTVTSGSGSGNGTVTYTVTSNLNTTQRIGYVTVATDSGVTQTHTVTQDGTIQPPQCTLSIYPQNRNFTASGGSGSVAVTAGCAWTAVSNASWVTITSGSSGNGNGTVYYTVASNSTTNSRTGFITLSISGSSTTHSVTQAAGVGSCTYSITPTSASYSYIGGTGSITLTTQSTCDWYAQSSAGWLSVISYSTGTGSATITYQVATNTSSNSRSATLTIGGTVGGQVVTVTQAGYNPSQCTLSISPLSRSFGSDGGASNLIVTTTCTWTAVSSAPWLTITSSNTGTGNGRVNYAMLPNDTGVSRTAYITVTVNGATQTHTVTQAAAF